MALGVSPQVTGVSLQTCVRVRHADRDGDGGQAESGHARTQVNHHLTCRARKRYRRIMARNEIGGRRLDAAVSGLEGADENPAYRPSTG